MTPELFRWVFDDPTEPFPATRFAEPEPGLIRRAVSSIMNMSERTAAVLCVAIAVVGVISIWRL